MLFRSLKSIGIEAVRFGLSYMRKPGGALRAHGSGREACQTGRGCAPIAHLKRSRAWRSCAVARRFVVAHGVELLRSCPGRAHLHGLKRSARVGLCASITPYI